MPVAGILFIAAGLACLLGLTASLANPAWFRFNGKVPARWKIARLWLLLTAICVLSQWTLEQITGSYRLSEAECIKYLAQLDRIGIIELKPLN